MYLKKAKLTRLPNNQLELTLLEKVKYGFFDFDKRLENCKFIKTNPKRPEKVDFWIYRDNLGMNCVGDTQIIAGPPTYEELETIITSNQGACYIEVTYDDEIESPSNPMGDRAILIHISFPKYVEATKEITKGFTYIKSEGTCPFCEKEDITPDYFFNLTKLHILAVRLVLKKPDLMNGITTA